MKLDNEKERSQSNQHYLIKNPDKKSMIARRVGTTAFAMSSVGQREEKA